LPWPWVMFTGVGGTKSFSEEANVSVERLFRCADPNEKQVPGNSAATAPLHLESECRSGPWTDVEPLRRWQHLRHGDQVIEIACEGRLRPEEMADEALDADAGHDERSGSAPRRLSNAGLRSRRRGLR
jgi:hypothetical protein